MRKLILASSMLLGFSAPLAAATPAKTAAVAPAATSIHRDVQCFILLTSAANSAKDEASAKPAMIGLAYFLGKVTRGSPTLNLLQAVKDESKALQASDPQKVGTACEQEFNSRMGDVDAMGKALSAGK